MIKKKIKFISFTSVCLLIISNLNVSAQQQAQFSMYMFNPLSINPAYAGSRDALSVTLLGRNQWVNVEGAPTTASLSIHSPLRNQAISLGMSVIQDEIGPTKNTSFFGDFAFRFNVTNHSKLSFGLKGGLDLFSANFGKLRAVDGTDIKYTTPIENQLMPNFGFGVYLNSDKYYVGLTVPKLIENAFNGAIKEGNQSKQDRHYFLNAGLTIKINSVVKFIPSFVLKAVEGAPLSSDFNVNFLFYEKLWIGAGYRSGDAIIANIVYHFTNKFRAGYAYDYTTSALSQINTGSHEIMLNFDLDFLGVGFKSPRYF